MSTTATKIKHHTAQRQMEIVKLNELKRVADNAVLDQTVHENFKCRYRFIDVIHENFEKVNTSLLNLLTTQEGVDIQEPNQTLIEFENDFYHIMTVYKSLFGDDSQQNPSPEPTLTHNNVRLPKMELPIFDGDVKGWQTFIDMFDSIIHLNDKLSNIEKFNYLISSLKGSPLQLVKCTPLASQNYLIAYNALKNRYQNTRLIATSHWHSIINTKKITNPENSYSLRHLLDTFNENIAVLESMNFPTSKWDFILFNLLFDRLDSVTATRFELEHSTLIDGEYYKTLVIFLNKQCSALDTVSYSKSSAKPMDVMKNNFSTNKPQFSKFKSTSTFVVNSNQKLTCQVCQREHLIYNCPNFISKTPEERYDLVRRNKWCTNCLGSKHDSNNCTSKGFCRLCTSPRKHHTLLHFPNNPRTGNNLSNSRTNIPNPAHTSSQETPPSQSNLENLNRSNTNSFTINLASSNPGTVLLSTAIVDVLDSQGTYQPVRVLLDSGSQSHFVSTKCCTKLGLSRNRLSLDIRGVGKISTHATHGVTCNLKPRNKSEPNFTLDFIILPQICSDLPAITMSAEIFSEFSNLELADPTFNISQPVDMLLGADMFAYILKGSFRHQDFNNPSDNPIALDTSFGWIIMGKVKSTPQTHSLAVAIDSRLEKSLNRFWELEQVPSAPTFTPEETRAEMLYQTTVDRDNSGKFVVSLPFKDDLPTFPDSRDIALRRFLSLERRLMKDQNLYRQYSDIMRDYLESKYMEVISDITPTPSSYYIPHHCVLKPENTTTKLRVVFDASSRCSNNLSLNDTLLIGPKLQPDICSVLCKFRLHPICFTADIKKMYNQILVKDVHRDFQRILWRFSSSDPVQDFRLNTVTFGVSSSPFLAIRTIQELANNYCHQFPIACNILKNDVFVDDIVTGCSSIDEAKQLQADLIAVLKMAGFELRKWASNDDNLISHLPPEMLKMDPLHLDLENISTLKILGLQWNARQDYFSYQVEPLNKPCTKRTILSELSRVYDPLGFLTPITLHLKVLLQVLWSAGVEWDSTPPENVVIQWDNFKKYLPSLSTLQIPRRISSSTSRSFEICGFCDASKKAYAAVVYLRTQENGSFMTHLLYAKSRVAPLKTISIPRLELCGALLLAGLLNFIQNTFQNNFDITRISAFSDSMIVLKWLHTSPHELTTFVSNRVSQIQEKVPPSLWCHVKSPDNPADPASRGLLPHELISCSQWWAGPHWLRLPRELWPENGGINDFSNIPDEELRQNSVLTSIVEENPLISLLNHHSSLAKIQRIICYVMRFIFHQIPSMKYSPISPPEKSGPVSMFEMEEALRILIKLTQQTSFAHEISLLKHKKPLPKFLRKLTPFVDDKGILRVGGRLTLSNLSFDQKHPALLPSNHRFTDLVILYTHSQYLHPGYQTLHFLLAQRYWILASKRTIRRVIASCLKCFRLHPKSPQPPMGNLPTSRIAQVKPFSQVGVDFCGPFKITMSKIRGAKVLKSYICVFCCMATKAIHLELTSDMSTDTFLAALRRLVARRGTVTDLFCDNGTNLVGASNELEKYMIHASDQQGIRFHFIPPASPNFGGIWEAGVKSVKTHLLRVVGDQTLTYEELYTTLVQIEAILNSRPLCALSSDPNDDSVLSPGHFLTLEPLNSVPEPQIGNLVLGRLSRWQLVQRLQQDFWRRWHQEYLHTLMQRSKWTEPSTPIELGTIVLLKDDLSSPLRWPRGRVSQLHIGADGITRVVTVRTAKGLLKRPVTKVCPLPNC